MKKNALILSAIVIFLVSFRPIEPATWALDNMHSNLGFSVGYLMISEIEGSFRMKEAVLTTPNEDFSDATVTMVADVKSVNTEIEDRDKHLKTADFFDAEKYPTLYFKSTSLKKEGKNKYKLTGDLALHGITKQVTVDMEYTGTIENPASKKKTAGFQVRGTIKRSDFNLGNGFPPPMISNEVLIKADGEFVQ